MLLGTNKVAKVKRPATKQDGIEAVRDVLGRCIFDSVKCKRLIECLCYYRYEWDETLAKYSEKPLHDWASDGADAMQTFGLRVRLNPYDDEEDKPQPKDLIGVRQSRAGCVPSSIKSGVA